MRVLETASPGTSSRSSARSDDGRAFLAELDAYLEEHGRRTSHASSTSARRRGSRIRRPLITVLQDAVTQPERDHGRRARRRSPMERERLTDEARERLAGFPEAVRGSSSSCSTRPGRARCCRRITTTGSTRRSSTRCDGSCSSSVGASRRTAASTRRTTCSTSGSRSSTISRPTCSAVVDERRARWRGSARCRLPPVLGVAASGPAAGRSGLAGRDQDVRRAARASLRARTSSTGWPGSPGIATRARAARALARGRRGARARRDPRRADDGAAVDAAVRARGSDRDRCRRHPQPLRRGRARVLDPGGRRGEAAPRRCSETASWSRSTERAGSVRIIDA